MFSVLNYPKSDSTFLTRTVSFFVGFAAWFVSDDGISLEKIIEVSSRNYYGSRAHENLYDLNPIKNENYLIVVGAAINTAITNEIVTNCPNTCIRLQFLFLCNFRYSL